MVGFGKTDEAVKLLDLDLGLTVPLGILILGFTEESSLGHLGVVGDVEVVGKGTEGED